VHALELARILGAHLIQRAPTVIGRVMPIKVENGGHGGDKIMLGR
jgi:hypothetical protein